jgi:hypothetical protein
MTLPGTSLATRRETACWARDCLVGHGKEQCLSLPSRESRDSCPVQFKPFEERVKRI